MNEFLNEVLGFIKKCDEDFFNDIYLVENAMQATRYVAMLKKIKKENNSNMVKSLIQKLEFIASQIDAFNYHYYRPEAILNLVSLSVTEYIINLTKEKRLTDPLLIARFVYIELSKVLYYDISYVKQQNETEKRIMCEASVDLKKEKIFSYVLCTQWLQLYSYILREFGIEVKMQNIPGQDHVWGLVNLSNDKVLIVDATDYINSSIDLSNAKSMSPTVGFLVLPKEYSNIKLYDVFIGRYGLEFAKKINEYYGLNRELDASLGYISKNRYKVEKIIDENELFNYSESIITDTTDLKRYMELALEFFRKLKIPNNMDGYEIYAYYQKFLNKLPRNVAANISQRTIYVDSFGYKFGNLRKKFLQMPVEYLKYLNGLVYSRYYKYLSDGESNSILSGIQKGEYSGEQVRDLIAKHELKIAQINRNLNFYYAINRMQFYDPFSCDTLQVQFYEPIMGTKIFTSDDECDEFESKLLIK